MNMIASKALRCEPDLSSYDCILVGFSGGKDSQACVLDLLERGVEPSRIELLHHLIDGREGSTLMDWPVTEDYCKRFAEAFGMRISFSWRKGGFEGEMNKHNSRSKPMLIEDDDNLIECGGNGKVDTRRMFPQQSASLQTRWCSAYLKIQVCDAVIRQPRFDNKRVLLITGERAAENTSFQRLAAEIGHEAALRSDGLKGRAKYKRFEPHATSCKKRHVDHWRPVHGWTDEQVWAIIGRWHVNPHPAYRLGWGRLSCMACIFASKNQWSSIREIDGDRFDQIAGYEQSFKVTINTKKLKGKTIPVPVAEMADAGVPYRACLEDHPLVQQAKAMVFDEPMITPSWTLPAGAFGESNGPI